MRAGAYNLKTKTRRSYSGGATKRAGAYNLEIKERKKNFIRGEHDMLDPILENRKNVVVRGGGECWVHDHYWLILGPQRS